MSSIITAHKILSAIFILIVLLAGFVVVEFLIVKYRGTPVLAPEIPRNTETLGSGPALSYVVMGDSTSIGQGSDYADSIGQKSAAHLAVTHSVSYTDVGISGATVKTVLDSQLDKAATYKPDVVLLSVGANDATHLTSGASIRQNLPKIIDGLVKANCNVKIVLTGSPQMGSVPRFPWPLKQFMGLRTKQINNAIASVISKQQLTLSPIAAKTGPIFAAHPELFASDKFHPTAAGYAVWIPVINDALDQALASQPSHCETN
jgi:lysophospholipase L1-like esterase